MKIVVPCDFTPVVEAALLHAHNIISHQIEASEIVLFHVLDRKATNADLVAIQLADLSDGFATRLGIPSRTALREGTINDDIAAFAEEEHADLIIMGIHDVTGWQKWRGSKAIHVVDNSNIPFLVVQAPPRTDNSFRHMLLPIGSAKEEVEKLNWAVKIAHQYGTRFTVYVEHFTDSSLISKTNANVQLMQRSFDSNGVKYELTKPNKAGGNKAEKLIESAQKEGVDALLIMITQDIRGIASVLDSRDQAVMANPHKLPVLCVNPAMLLN